MFIPCFAVLTTELHFFLISGDIKTVLGLENDDSWNHCCIHIYIYICSFSISQLELCFIGSTTKDWGVTKKIGKNTITNRQNPLSFNIFRLVIYCYK